MKLKILLVCASILVLAMTPAYGMSRDMKTIIKYGAYGFLGGTAVGLVTLPLHQDIRGTFIGSSLGLYIGFLIGIYQATHRYDPENPLHFEPPKSSQANTENSLPALTAEQGAKTPDDYYAHPPVMTWVSVPIVRF